jgi:hypothetical protein
MECVFLLLRHVTGHRESGCNLKAGADGGSSLEFWRTILPDVVSVREL